MRKTLIVGYITLMMAQVAFAGNLIINKYLLTSLDMFVFLEWRFIFATVGFGLMFWLSGSRFSEPNHPQGRFMPTDWISCILQGFFAGLLFNYLFSCGLQKTTATAAGIICSTLPAIIAFFAVFLLNERLGRSKITAIVLAMLGIIIINADHLDGSLLSSEHSILGDALVFLAIIPEALYCILSRKLGGRVTPMGSALLTNLFATLMLLPFAFTQGAFDIQQFPSMPFSLIFLAGFCSIGFYWGCAWGLSFISASTAGLFAGVLPIATTVIAILFLGESLRWLDIAGMGLVLLSIVIGTQMHYRFRRKAALIAEG